MGKSLLQSIREKLGHHDVPVEMSPALKKRIGDVSDLFPEAESITPAVNINPEWCFHVELDNGDRFLAWLHTGKLSGLTEDDAAKPFPDCEPAKSFRHPNVLKPVLIDQIGEHTIVVTEDFEGSSLLEILDTRTFDKNHATKVFHEVAIAIRQAHKAGVLHRAINSANILVDDDLNVRIFGLGLANMFFDQWDELLRKKKRRIVDYIAPELENAGLEAAVPHCDGYAIARVTYELLTGTLPKTTFVVLPSKMCDVPAYMDDALLNAMHSEPEKRPQTIGDFYKCFSGQQNREAKLAKLRERQSATERIATIFDKYFQWVHSDWFRVVVVLMIFGLIFLGFYLFERLRIEPMVSLSSEFIPGVQIDQWENQSHEELKDIFIGEEKYIPDVTSSPDLAIINRNAEPTYTVVERRAPTQPQIITVPSRQNPVRRQSVGVVIAPNQGHSTSMSRETIRLPGRAVPQPDSPLVIALEQLKLKNPAQTDWHFHLLVTRQRTILDLSGHANLRDISPLHGLGIHELDISFTAVDKIYDLIGMPLDELRLDSTAVTDLDPIVGLPLGVLTFIDTPVKNISATRQIQSLRCILGHDVNGPINQILPPLPDQKTWMNDQGLKFRALPGIAAMLAVHEFPDKEGTEFLTSITFKKAENLCSHMTVRERKSGSIASNHRYRLATDGEWSYAALLEESRFLSPTGRLLQRVDEYDFQRNLKSHILLEIKEGSPDYERAHNGFWGMKNHIGEWVDHSHGNWDGTNLVRGMSVGTDLENLRTRTREYSDADSKAIGFRPVLEIESSKYSSASFDEANPEDLSFQIPKDWVAPHLRSAARSSYVLKSLLTSQTYRDSFIAHQSQKRDPFENRFYLRMDVPMSWIRARAVANQLGGRLATASSRKHLDWMNEQFLGTNPLGTPLWMGASAYPFKADWNWITHIRVPHDIQPDLVDSDKRRGALLASRPNDESPLMTATPVSEKHAFLIEWD